MAATVTANLTDVTLGETADSGYWTGSDGNSAEIYRQGAGSEGWVVSKSSNETATFDYFAKAAATLDMSPTGTHLYVTIRCDIAPFIDYLHIGLFSDTAHGAATTGNTYWTVVDNVTVIEWAGEWITIKLDVNNATTFSTSGTLDLSAVDTVGFNVDNSNSGNIRSIENTYIDAVRFGLGLKITGTAWDWQEVADDDNLNANKYDIVRQVGPGVFEVNGQLQIGDGATTTTPTSSNETLFFKDISTSGIEGGPIGKQAAGFYKVIVTGSGCVCDFNNMSILSSANATFVFDADDTALPDSSIDWDAGTVIECSSFLSDGAQAFLNMGFFNCGQIVPAGSTFTGFLIDNYTGTDGAILWPGGTTVKNGTIQNSDRAIEITQAINQSFDNISFPSNTYDVHLNNGGTDIDVSKTNGSDPTNYIATGGGVVTFVGASVTITIICLDSITTSAIEGVAVTLTANGSGPYPFESSVTITRIGSVATVAHTGHGLGTGQKVLIYGANQNEYNRIKTITKVDADEYTYPVSGTPDTPATGTIEATAVFLDELTNASGIVSDTRVFATDQNATGYAAKGTSSPLYVRAGLTGTVDSVDGLPITSIMTSDE